MSSGFITESDLVEARKKRQEEWEKVRTPDQPIERPEEPYDGRSLYERLKEQKMKKDLEFEEAHKLKNLIRGLDDDEVEYLSLVDKTKLKVEKLQKMEDEKELKDFRNRVANLQEQSMNNKTESDSTKVKPKSLATSTRTSQKSLIGSVVRKRKNGEVENNVKNRKTPKPDDEKEDSAETPQQESVDHLPSYLDRGALTCIGILPGIGKYTDSSDSEVSSDSDGLINFGKYDLIGRDRSKLKKMCNESE